MDLFRKTYAEIDLLALENNINWIKDQFPNSSFFCPMVKGNAYGHGDYIIAKSLSGMGVPYLGVCLIEEALWLKQAGIETSLVVFRGFDNEGAKEIIANDFIPIVSQWEQLEYLEKNIKDKPIIIHLKFDTGMNRLGFSEKDAKKIFDRLWNNKKLRLKGILTHFYFGEDFLVEEGHSQRQLKAFIEIAKIFKSYNPILHVFNSAGIVGAYLKPQPEFHSFGLRPGLLIYGYAAPMINHSQPFEFLKPVMSLKSHVSDIKMISKGQGISYSHTWKATRDSIIAIIPIGYADGVHRLLSNRGEVIVKNLKAPIVGNICMDYLMVDLTEISQFQTVRKNETVILLGQSEDRKLFIGAQEVAKQAQTITWEILTSIGIRVPRLVIKGTEK